MRTPTFSIANFRSALNAWHVTAAGLLMVALAGSAEVEAAGDVFYVDDLPAATATQPATPAQTTPTQKDNRSMSRSPSPMRYLPNVTSRKQPATLANQATSAKSESKSWLSKIGWKNPFGSKAKPAETASNVRSGQRLTASQQVSNPSFSSRGKASPAKREGSSVARSTSRRGGLQTRPTGGNNVPQGLLAFGQKKSSPERPTLASVKTRRSAAPSQATSQILPLPIASNQTTAQPARSLSLPTLRDNHGVAFVSDFPNRSDLRSKLNQPKPMPLPMAKTPVAKNNQPLPQVVGPPQVGTQVVANRSTQPQPTPNASLAQSWQSTTSRSPAPKAAPVEVVNQHVAATEPRHQAQVASNIVPVGQPVHAVRPASAVRRISRQPATSRQPARLSQQATKMARPVSLPKNPVAPIPVAPAPPAEDTLKPSPKAVEILSQANRLSQTASSETEYTTVIQTCRHVLAIDASPAAVAYSTKLAGWALNRRGERKADEGRTQEALLDFEDALRLDSKRWRAIHNRGVIAAQAGRFADAFDDFDATIEINPKFAKAYSNRAALYVQARKLSEAKFDYQRAISIDPDLAIAHKGRGRVCHMLGEFQLALQHFDAAMLLSPGDARIVNSRGDLLVDMGRYRAAAANYRQAIKMSPSLASAYRNLAWLQATCPDRECRQPALGLENAKQAMKLVAKPSDLEYDTLAAAQAAMGDFDAAQASMNQAMQMASDSDKPNYQWRLGLYEQGQAYVTEPASDIQQASYAD